MMMTVVTQKLNKTERLAQHDQKEQKNSRWQKCMVWRVTERHIEDNTWQMRCFLGLYKQQNIVFIGFYQLCRVECHQQCFRDVRFTGINNIPYYEAQNTRIASRMRSLATLRTAWALNNEIIINKAKTKALVFCRPYPTKFDMPDPFLLRSVLLSFSA